MVVLWRGWVLGSETDGSKGTAIGNGEGGLGVMSYQAGIPVWRGEG